MSEQKRVEMIAGELLETEPCQELIDILTEIRACRKTLNRIAGWVALLGTLLLVGLALAACGLVL